MSRVAKKPIALPKGVELRINEDTVSVKGPKGALTLACPQGVRIEVENDAARLTADDAERVALAGTVRAILANMVLGVSVGFERKLELVGVGYRANMAGKDLNLSVGYSHPVLFKAPEGVSLETPSQTEIVIKGPDKQLVGQVAAEIRGFRPPEPYKGKGIRYAGEKINMKEAKKA